MNFPKGFKINQCFQCRAGIGLKLNVCTWAAPFRDFSPARPWAFAIVSGLWTKTQIRELDAEHKHLPRGLLLCQNQSNSLLLIIIKQGRSRAPKWLLLRELMQTTLIYIDHVTWCGSLQTYTQHGLHLCFHPCGDWFNAWVLFVCVSQPLTAAGSDETGQTDSGANICR
jgi:hypothetical protein